MSNRTPYLPLWIAKIIANLLLELVFAFIEFYQHWRPQQ